MEYDSSNTNIKKIIDTGIEKFKKYINFNIALTNLFENVFILLVL